MHRDDLTHCTYLTSLNSSQIRSIRVSKPSPSSALMTTFLPSFSWHISSIVSMETASTLLKT